MKELLFVWGPRPGEAAVEWVKAQAQNAPPADRGAWLLVLGHIGAVMTALDVASSWTWKAIPGMADVAEKLLWIAGIDSVEATRIFRDATFLDEPAALLRFAAIARGAKRYSDAESCAAEALARSETRAAALLMLAGIANDRRDMQKESGYLDELFHVSDDELSKLPPAELSRAAFQYASFARKRGETERARAFFLKALGYIDGHTTETIDSGFRAQLVAEAQDPSRGADVLVEESHRRTLTVSERALLGRLLTQAGRLEEAKAAVFAEGPRT